VLQPTRVSIETFSTSGKLLTRPFDQFVAPGAYRVPAGIGMAAQIVCVRVACGSDVRVFRMRGAMSSAKANIKYNDPISAQARLLKAAAAAGDTLVLTRTGYTARKWAVASLTATDSSRVSLWPACANDSVGGRLYDKFWVAKTGYSQTDTARVNFLTRNADFFRCEQCHGYDLLGRAGTSGNRAPTAKRPNVADFNLSAKLTAADSALLRMIKIGTDSTKRRAFDADLSTYSATNAAVGDKMPKYSTLLSDKQIWGLVRFLKTGYTDPKLLCDYTITGTYPNAVIASSNIGKDGDTASGHAIYTKNCKNCHGANGKSSFLVDGYSYSVGSHVRMKPYQAAFTMKYHLYGNTPHYTTQQMKDLMKALTDTVKYPNPTTTDSIYCRANGLNGGRLYDQFWLAETTFTADTGKFNQYADFFRCKQCHGWDLLGSAGAYANRAPTTKRPNVCGLNLFSNGSKSLEELFKAIKTGADSTKRRAKTADLSTYDPASATNKTVGDQMPNYGAIMSDRQIWDLVRFLKAETFDVKQIYDCTVTGTYPTATVAFANLGRDGSAAAGNAFFTTNCTPCHNADGKKFTVGGTPGVGSHVRANPAEDVIKIKFGVCGSTMKSRSMTVQNMKDLYRALSDTTKYPN
jgi:mono/diheme cytochrome c family protein